MRCFISIPLPEDIKEILIQTQKRLFGHAKVRWIAKKNLHLTIKFLGEITEKDIKEIKERLSKIKFESIKTKLNALGTFPDLSYIRVIWVNLTPEERIIKLQQKIDQELLYKFPQEQRFSTHITLGRVKFIKKKKDFIKQLKETKIPDKEFTINEFQLMKSTLTKDGPIYNVIETFKTET